jgi:hypothetical protein
MDLAIDLEPQTAPSVHGWSPVRSVGQAIRKISNLLNTPRFWWGAIALTCLALFFPPSRITVRAWDFLDSFVALQHLRPSPLTSLFRLDAVAERAANGLSLNSLGLSELNLISIIYSVFPMFLDTALQLTLQVLLLFGTTLAILTRLLPAHLPFKHLIAGATSFYIALLPINPVVVGAVIGANLVIVGLLWINENPDSLRPAIPFVLAPLVSQAPFGPVFYYPAFLLLATVAMRGKARSRALLFLLASFALTFVVDYRLFLSTLFPDEPNHRLVWLDGRSGNPFAGLFDASVWQQAWEESSKFFFLGQGHYLWNPNGATTPLILLGLPAAALVLLMTPSGSRMRRLGDDMRTISNIGLYLAALSALLLICLGTGLLTAKLIDFFALLKTPLQVNRATMVFAPIVAAVTIAASLALVVEAATSLRLPNPTGSSSFKLGIDRPTVAAIAACACVGIMLAATASASHLVRYKADNLRQALAKRTLNAKMPHPTIAAYYKSELFDALKAHLGPDWANENIVSVGLDPMIASANGFRHLDGYFQSYPLAYKAAFRKIIAPEFAIDPRKKSYFDTWGSRVYVFSDRKEGGRSILNIDGCALAQLGGTLLISRLEIANPADSALVPAGRVSAKTQKVSSALHLYRIRDGACPG